MPKQRTTPTISRLLLAATFTAGVVSLSACDEEDAYDDETRAAEFEFAEDGQDDPDGEHGRHGAHHGKHHGKHQFFEKMDADQNGSISKTEANERLAAHFDEIDADGDGELTKDELHQHHEQRRAEHHAKMFAELDADGSGGISATEAENAPGPLAEHFAKIDADADGQLTQDELEAAHAKMRKMGHGKHRRRGKHGDPMKHFDTDGSDTISADEAKGPMAEHFAEIDADGDGELSRDELKSHHEKMRSMHGGHRGPHGDAEDVTAD